MTSEATHIYDPKTRLLKAYRILADQWRIAFEIGAQNRKNGTQPTTVRVLLRLLAKNYLKQYLKQYLKKSERSGEDARPIRTEAERSSQVASEA